MSSDLYLSGKENILMRLFKKKKNKPVKKNIDTDLALENLLLAKNILNEKKMDFWLTDGTLLGFYRDNGFIEHDEDIDLGCLIEDLNETVLFDFLDNGFKLDSIYGNRNIGLEFSFKRKEMKLDIFFFYKEDHKFWHGAWVRKKINGVKKDNLIKYSYDPFKLIEIEFYGHKFNAPDNIEKYIETKYGKNWKEPVKEWDWAHGPSNSEATDIYL